MSIVLLVKILGLLVYCDKAFPVSSGYCNTRDTFSRKSGIILSTYFQRLVFSQGREKPPPAKERRTPCAPSRMIGTYLSKQIEK
jgi:hypothetical protein